MDPHNPNPLDELKSLDQQVERVNELAALKPIFFRLDEIAKENASDFEVQLAVGDIKQHLVNRGIKLKQTPAAAEPARPVPPPLPPPPPVPAPPPPPTAAETPPPEINGPLETTKHVPPVIPALPTEQIAAFPAMPAAPAEPSSPPASRFHPAASPPAPPPEVPVNWKRALGMGAVIGIVIALISIAVLFGVVRKRHQKEVPGTALVAIDIATTPSGASVSINGEQKCISNCKVSLPPGNYQVTASLDGYEASASSVALIAGQPASVSLALEPQAQSLRILTDLDKGRVTFDDQPPVDLQEGQFVVDRVQPGPHTVKIASSLSEGSFSFEASMGKIPAVNAVSAKNLNAVIVASQGNQARVFTNSGPLKLAVNGQAEADASPAGVELKAFQTGVDELVVGEGKDQRSVKESFSAAPALTAFFKTDLNIGTLIVSTGEDGARVFLNDKEYARRTKRGEIRIQTIGRVTVRVAKDGFEAPPPQIAEIKKGAETRLEFKLQPVPQFSSLVINGATPGAAVLIDQRSVGTIGPDGSFSNTMIVPGDHAIDLRRDQFVPRRFQRIFRAGQTVTLSGSDVVLAAEKPAPPPEKKVEPPPPPPRQTAAAPPPPAVGTMSDWEDNSLWHTDGGIWVHRGAALLFYKMRPKGVFSFTVQLLKGGNFFRGGKIRWVLDYIDNKNYALFELDSKNFVPKVIMNGVTYQRDKTALKDLEKQKSFTMQIDIEPDHIVHRMMSMGGDWITIDNWAEPGRNFSAGKFGFQVQGNDEIGITDFKFQPK